MELEQSGGARKSESQCRKSEAHPGEAGKWAREERDQLEFKAKREGRPKLSRLASNMSKAFLYQIITKACLYQLITKASLNVSNVSIVQGPT